MLAGQGWQSIFEMPQIAVVMGCMIPIVAIICGFWFNAQKVRSEHELKEKLVARGLSADEIKQIIVY